MSKLKEAYDNFIQAVKVNRKETGKGAFTLTNGPAPVIPMGKLAGSTLVSHRNEILNYMPKDAIFAEVGTLYGDFAKTIIDMCNPSKLYCFDINFKRFNYDIHNDNVKSKKIELISGKSWVTLNKFPDNFFDVIYVDADHTYGAVRKDLSAALLKIKPNGYIICNDFTNWAVGAMEAYGVYKAACEFIKENDVQVTHLALQPYCYFDLAFKVNK